MFAQLRVAVSYNGSLGYAAQVSYFETMNNRQANTLKPIFSRPMPKGIEQAGVTA